ncbi:MAG: HlyC/CorC family transporter [Kiritimatiellae bacterium]|nr:HlyC/CorC family transporter [Kiritimatiellia bacterium]
MAGLILQLLTMLVLFALSAFFSGSETILFSITPAQRQRIRERDAAADKRIGLCLSDSARLLSTLLVGNTLVNFAIASLGYRLFVRMIPVAGGLLAVPAMTVALLLFCEITPKQIALRRVEALAPACARLLLFWGTVFAPFNAVLHVVSSAFSKSLSRERRALSDGELVSVLEEASERGEFSAADAEMVEGVLRLSELSANDEMIPRVDMETYDLDLSEAARAAVLAGTTRRHLPVIRRTPDAVEGVYDRQTGRIEAALFVPETVTLDDLLVTFRRSGKPLAIVLDEYGGTAGLISPSDVLEIIFGPQVFGEGAAEEPAIVQTGPRTWEIDARANLDEINRELGVELEADDADRLSGWVAFHAERLPHVGQEIEADGCRATILRRRHRRVTLVRLEVMDFPPAASDEHIIEETDEEVEKTEEDDE